MVTGPATAAASGRSTSRAQRLALAIGLAGLLAWLGGYAYVYAVQDRLIFPTRPLSAREAAEVVAAFPGTRSLTVHASDGTSLHAWYRPAAGSPELHKVLVYFGASSEQVHWQLAPRAAFAGWDLLLVDYRGYGLSGGRPGQAELQGDADVWLDCVKRGAEDISRADRIVVMGTSMGSYFATHAAATRKIDGVVLVVPADSVRSLAQSMLPMYPVGWLLKHPFDSLADAPSVTAPTLFFVAMQDKLDVGQAALAGCMTTGGAENGSGSNCRRPITTRRPPIRCTGSAWVIS